MAPSSALAGAAQSQKAADAYTDSWLASQRPSNDVPANMQLDQGLNGIPAQAPQYVPSGWRKDLIPYRAETIDAMTKAKEARTDAEKNRERLLHEPLRSRQGWRPAGIRIARRRRTSRR